MQRVSCRGLPVEAPSDPDKEAAAMTNKLGRYGIDYDEAFGLLLWEKISTAKTPSPASSDEEVAGASEPTIPEAFTSFFGGIILTKELWQCKWCSASF